MSNFFRWATFVIVLGTVVLGAGYFVWLRDARLVSSAHSTGLSVAQISVPGSSSISQLAQSTTTPAVSTTISPTQSTTRTLTIITPESRPAVVIVPAPDTMPAGSAESSLESAATRAVNGEEAPPLDATAPVTGLLATPTPTALRTDNLTTLLPTTVPTSPALTTPGRFAPVPVPQSAFIGGSEAEIEARNWVQPAAPVLIPQSLAFGIPTPIVRAQIVVAPIVTALPPGPSSPISAFLPVTSASESSETQAIQPLAANIQLYRAPDLNTLIEGGTTTQSALEIVARDTTGRWLLLVDGQWVQAATVQNPPTMLPLVVPTVTPTPTNTGLPTPTEEPLPTATPWPTATPTPTSMDFAVCDCTPNTYACVTHHFPVRAQAQACFEYCFRQTGRDVHNLDPDNNGLACENLPSP